MKIPILGLASRKKPLATSQISKIERSELGGLGACPHKKKLKLVNHK